MSIGKYILIDPSECPSRDELADGIERLNKCSDILSRIRTKKDVSPESLRRVASFLEMLYRDNRLNQNTLSDDEEILAEKRIKKSKEKKNQ